MLFSLSNPVEAFSWWVFPMLWREGRGREDADSPGPSMQLRGGRAVVPRTESWTVGYRINHFLGREEGRCWFRVEPKHLFK